MTLSDDELALGITALLHTAPGVIQLYPPAGRIPLLATATHAVSAAVGESRPAVEVQEHDGVFAVRAALGMDTTMPPKTLVGQLCEQIRGFLAEHRDEDAASAALIELTVVRIAE